MRLPFLIAGRYLVRQQGSFSAFIIRIAIAATALSVMVMILATGIITGFQESVREKLFGFWGHVHVVPYNENPSTIISPDPIRYSPALRDSLLAYKDVRAVYPFALRPAIIQANGRIEGIKLKGVMPDYKPGPGIELAGAPIRFGDSASSEILLSKSMAGRLGLKPGDPAFLYFLNQNNAFPRIRKVRIAGTYHSGMDELDRYFGVCDLRLLQRINGWAPDRINGYQLMVDRPGQSDSIAADLFRQPYLQPPLETVSIRDIYMSIFDWLGMQDVNVRILIVIMALVTIINLSAALLILIVDRARMVALFQALGMDFAQIRNLFLILAGMIGAAGIGIGTAVSVLLAVLQRRYGLIPLPEATYYMDRVPVHVVWWHVALIDGATLLTCLLGMLLPALYVKRIQPAKLLQFK